MEFRRGSLVINPLQKKIYIFNGEKYIAEDSYKNETDLTIKAHILCDEVGYIESETPKIIQDIPAPIKYVSINDTYDVDERETYLLIGYCIGITLMMVLGIFV